MTTTAIIGFADSALRDYEKDGVVNATYGFSEYHAAVAYSLSRNVRHAELAINLALKRITDDPLLKTISRDQCLYIGGTVKAIVAVIEHCALFLTDLQDDTCKQYIGKALEFLWAGKNRWGSNDPENNYFYSFMLATACAARVLPQLAGLAAEKIQMAVDHHVLSRGGGSREGTGYGVSQSSLFNAVTAMGKKLSLSQHAADTIHYIVHATCPDFNNFALFGDQPLRGGMIPPTINDRVIIWMLTSYDCTSDDNARRLARWWLNKINFKSFVQKEHCAYYLIDIAGPEEPPTATQYYSAYTGHFFFRDNWNNDAFYFTQAKTPSLQSHNKEGCGAVNIFFGGQWQALSQSAYSKDGLLTSSVLETGTFVQNVIRFVDVAGKTIPQRGVSSDDGFAQYVGGAARWKRKCEFINGTLLLTDEVSAAPGVKKIWQLNVKELPKIAGSKIQSGTMMIELSTPLSIKVDDWFSLNAGYGKGYRITAEYAEDGIIAAKISDSNYPAEPTPTPTPTPEPVTTTKIDALIAAAEKVGSILSIDRDRGVVVIGGLQE